MVIDYLGVSLGFSPCYLLFDSAANFFSEEMKLADMVLKFFLNG